MASMNYRSSEYGSIHALRDSNYGGTPAPTTPYRDDPNVTGQMGGSAGNLDEKNELYAAPRTKTKRKALVWGLVGGGLILLLVAVVVPVYFTVIKKNGSDDNSSSGGSSSGDGHSGNSGGDHTPTPVVATWGGDGSKVTKEDGSTFVYNNTFGGYWVYDSANPLNQSARAQSYSPPLSEEWKWGVDKIYG